MEKPQTKDLSPPLAEVARGIASKLQTAGFQAWLVGGVVRDLALKRSPSDVDLTTDATPSEIEALFDETIAVGRAFGTMIVRLNDVSCEVTTFRSESSYSDARHPDEVEFSKSPEVDALRRDFTCNALYLDPVSDQLLDPTGGFDDLAAGRLHCVGEPEERFGEDALRILRLARFAASPGLEPAAETILAAQKLAPRLAQISPERRLKEILSIFSRPAVERAVQVLAGTNALQWAFFEGQADVAARCRERFTKYRECVLAPEGWMAVLSGSFVEAERANWRARLDALRPARDLVAAVAAIGSGVRELEELARQVDSAPRSRVIRALRMAELDACFEIAGAGGKSAGLDALLALRAELNEADLRPELWIASSDLQQLAVPSGPRWAELLREAETRQLNGEFANREAALEWLASAV